MQLSDGATGSPLHPFIPHAAKPLEEQHPRPQAPPVERKRLVLAPRSSKPAEGEALATAASEEAGADKPKKVSIVQLMLMKPSKRVLGNAYPDVQLDSQDWLACLQSARSMQGLCDS